MPVFAYKAIADEVTSIGTSDDHLARICGVGANILYQRNTIGGHEDAYFAFIPSVLKWLGSVLSGDRTEPTVGCKVENVALSH